MVLNLNVAGHMWRTFFPAALRASAGLWDTRDYVFSASVNTLKESVRGRVKTRWNLTLTFKRLKYVHRVPHLKTQLWLSSGIIVIDSWKWDKGVSQTAESKEKPKNKNNKAAVCPVKEEKNDSAPTVEQVLVWKVLKFCRETATWHVWRLSVWLRSSK